jgi:ribosomal protein S18 acetylase RimI-like enzyme
MKPQEQELSPISLRRANERDLDALLTIEQQCFNVYYYDYYMLDRRDFEYYLQDADCLFLVAAREARVISYVLGPVDTWRNPPNAHINSIAVLPEIQHQGIGTLLLRSFTKEARRQGCTRMTLEVSTANEVGLAFFAKHGFRRIRGLPDYYGKGLGGLLMAVELG